MKLSSLVQSLLFFLAFCLLTMHEIFVSPLYIIVAFVLVMPYFMQRMLEVLRRKKQLSAFFFCTLVFSILNIPFTGSGIGGTINFIVCFTMAIYLLENPKTAVNFSLLFCMYIISFLWLRLVVGGEDPYTLYEENLGVSRNFPGFLLVAASSFWCFTKKEDLNKLPLAVPILAIILVFLINGRSSLVAVGLLLIVCLVMRGNSKVSFFVLLGLAIASVVYFYSDLEELFMMSRLAEEGADNTARQSIWGAYIYALDPISFIFGLDTESIPVLNAVGGNPHNAFLNYHRRMGLIPLLFIIYFIIKSLRWFLHKKELAYAFVLVIFIFRIFFDSSINTTYDFIFYYMIFYPFFKEGRDSNKFEEIKSHRKGVKERIVNLIKLIA